MFHILVILLGLLNNNPSTVTLNSNFVYDNMEVCEESKGSPEVIRDIKNFAFAMSKLGYTDIEIKEYKCIPVDKDT